MSLRVMQGNLLLQRRRLFRIVQVSRNDRQNRDRKAAIREFSRFCMVCCFFSVLCFFCCCTSQNRLPEYVYYRLTTNPTTLDPALVVDVTGGTISAKLFNGLVRIGDDLSIRPDIAQQWRVSRGGTAYTFTLKKGVYFTNKREVNAMISSIPLKE